ncbi:MAG TPA: sensor histidine kinase [Miltoncostaeaceae bacterium]|nr:sensor histidine kinase [Miltoncostaeaceae bacterium]
MSSGGEQITGAAVEALLGVVMLDADASQGDDAVARLAEAVRTAADAPGVAVRILDHRLDRGRIVASAGASDEAWEAVAAAVDAARPGAPMEVGPGDGAPSAALAAAGLPHALVLPVAEASRGLVIVAGDEPLDGDPVRRAAVAAGAGRIGAVLDAARMRDNLERAMAQILATDERMLGRMGLDIHDGPTQQLSVALLEVQLLEADIADAADQGLPTPDSLRPALGRIYETVGGALHEMRELIGHLRPAQFEDRTLKDILGDALVAFEARADCEVRSEFDGEFPVNGVSITQRITFYRILQETLSNAHRHGHAQRVHVRLSEDERGTALEVRDDGRGFDPEAVQRRKPGMPLARFGLHGMRDRAQILGGTFEAVSTPGEGATIRVFLPRWTGPAPEVAVDAA